MKKKILVTDINWDVDEGDIEELGLPNEVMIDNPSRGMISDVESGGYCDDVAECLSDEYGWCVCGFTAEVVNR